MKRIILLSAVVIAFSCNAHASCDRLIMSQVDGYDKNDLHRELCRYYKELRQQEKSLNSMRKVYKNYQSDSYEFCKEEVSQLEQLFVKKFRRIPECP